MKARRLLVEGSVTVTDASYRQSTALVIGDHGEYVVRYNTEGWSCECPCPRECSHVIAVRNVTTRSQSPPHDVSL